MRLNRPIRQSRPMQISVVISTGGKSRLIGETSLRQIYGGEVPVGNVIESESPAYWFSTATPTHLALRRTRRRMAGADSLRWLHEHSRELAPYAGDWAVITASGLVGTFGHERDAFDAARREPGATVFQVPGNEDRGVRHLGRR